MSTILLKKIRFFSAFILVLILAFSIFYISKIEFGEVTIINKNSSIVNVIGKSPLNSEKQFEKRDTVFYFYGYLSSVILEINGESLPENFLKESFISQEVEIVELAGGKKLVTSEIWFITKVKLFFKVNRRFLIPVSLVFLLYLFFLIYPETFINPLKKFYKNAILHIMKLLEILIGNKLKIVLIPIIVLAIVIITRFLFGIKFEILYFKNIWLIYSIVFGFLLIPVTGIVFNKYLSNARRIPFYCFWSIFILLYFFVCPADFVGNYGFHGFFHEFIVRPSQLGVFKSLLEPDTGYFAIIPRIAYGLGYYIDANGASSIALTSLFSLIIYAWIFSLLSKIRFRFLIESDILRAVFVIFMAVFSLFTLSLSKHYALSISDVGYYGIILLFILSFRDFSKTSYLKLIVSILIGALFVFSKAHVIVLLPLYIIHMIYRLLKKECNVKELVFKLSIIVFAVIHFFYIYNSMQQMAAMSSGSIQSFSVDPKSPFLLLSFSVVYFIKSYTYFIFPYIELLHGFTGFIVTMAGLLVFGSLLIYAIRLYKVEKTREIAMWFFSGNILAFTSVLFFFITFPKDLNVSLNMNVLKSYLSQGSLIFSRYTIGAHTILAITVIPLIISFFKQFLEKWKNLNRFKTEFFVVLCFVALSSSFHSRPRLDLKFWDKAKLERWSEEWFFLSRRLSEHSYYLPIVFYPAKKQQVQTNDQVVLFDRDSSNSDFVVLDDKFVSTIVVLNTVEFARKHSDIELKLLKENGDSLFLLPDYPVKEYFKFIVFNTDSPIVVKSIKFADEKGKIIQLKSYRIIGNNKSH